MSADTIALVCRAPREDGISDERLLAIYRGETWDRLRALERALHAERGKPESQAWCDRRLLLLARVLGER